MSELRELTPAEITAICAAIECEIADIKLELNEHDRDIQILDDDRYQEQADALYFYESWLLYQFRQCEKESFGLRDAINPEDDPYPDSLPDKLVILEFKEVSFVRYALGSKIGYIKMDLRGDDLDEDKCIKLQRDLKFYKKLFNVFNTAERMAPKLRQLPQIAYRRRRK